VKTSQLFGEEFQNLVLKFFLRVPYLICNSIIFLGVFKYKRRNLLVKNFYENKGKLSTQEYDTKSETIL
jgi:hypothetical protein